MEVREIRNGLWRWTTWYEEWRAEVGCVYAETPDGICLIDPLVPADEPGRFWAALDRDVERAGGEVHVLITIFWHVRSTREVVERYGGRLWSSSRGRAAVARRAGDPTDTFRPGEPLPGGIRAFASGRATEVVYWLPGHRALVPGDVILGAKGGGGLELCPESWLPDGVGHEQVRKTLRPLLELPVARVLVSHGRPVLRDGAAALTRLLRS